MKKYKPKKNDMVLIKWKDAATTARWVDPAEHADASTVSCMSVGIFVERRRGDIKVALSYSESGDYGDILAIPFSQVTEIYKLIGDEGEEELPVSTDMGK